MNYLREMVRKALDDAKAPSHHPDIGASARKPMTPQERIAALAKQRDELLEAVGKMLSTFNMGDASEHQVWREAHDLWWSIKKGAEMEKAQLVSLDDVIGIVSAHPEYPEPCPMLHEVAAKAAAEMDKEWVMHMVRETCRQTKEAILADLNHLCQTKQVEARRKPTPI